MKRRNFLAAFAVGSTAPTNSPALAPEKAPPAPVVTAREARETQLFVLNKIAEQLVQNDTFFATATVFVTPDGMIRGAVFSDLATDRPAPRSKNNGT